MNIFERFSTFLSGEDAAEQSIDSTLYKIETDPHEYIGKIIYQDDIVIKFKRQSKDRLVKILKSNIKCISIMQGDAVVHIGRLNAVVVK